MYESLPKQLLSKMRVGKSLSFWKRRNPEIRNSQEIDEIQDVDEMYTFLKR